MKELVILFALLPVFASSQINHSATYRVRRGGHDFRPNPAHQVRPISGAYTLTFTGHLNADCWYNTEAWRCGESRNKIAGIGRYFSRNNRNAFLIAWYPAQEESLFNLSLYENDARGGWKEHAGIQVQAGETFEATYTRGEDGKIRVRLSASGRWCAHTWERGYFGPDRIRGPYFGGRCFSSHERTLFLETKLKKHGTEIF